MFLKKVFDYFSKAKKPSLKVRFSQAADVNNILQYYKDNQHQHVHIREAEWYASHARKGQYLLGLENDGNIIASTGTYDYIVNGDGDGDVDGKPSYYELGSTSFKPGKGTGYNLYPFFIASQVVQAFLEHPPKEMCIANVYDDSPVGKKMLVPIVGWKEIQPSEDILAKFKSSKSADHTNNNPMTWYGTPTDTIPHMARIVLDFLNKGEVTNKKTGDVLKLDVSDFSLAQDFRHAVEMLAHGPVANHLENNPHMGMKAAREYLENHRQSRIEWPIFMPY